MIELEKEKKKNPGKDKWETLDVIPLIPLIGVNNRQHILHMYKRMVQCYSAYESINQYSIGYMINTSLNSIIVFREQVEKCLSVSFNKNTMETIRDFLKKKNTCVMVLIMIYENNGGN